MKTVSLELSKELKEAGYPQNTVHHKWHEYDKSDEFYIGEKDRLFTHAEWEEFTEEYNPSEGSFFASPTADEILDLLPKKIKGTKRGVLHWLQVEITEENGWSCQYFNPNFGVIHFEESNTLADSCAKMYLYLRKEGLL